MTALLLQQLALLHSEHGSGFVRIDLTLDDAGFEAFVTLTGAATERMTGDLGTGNKEWRVARALKGNVVIVVMTTPVPATVAA